LDHLLPPREIAVEYFELEVQVEIAEDVRIEDEG